MARIARHIALAVLATMGAWTVGAQMLPVLADKQWGLIDSAGRLLVKPRYEAIVEVTETQAVVVQQGKYGLVDRSGAVLVPTSYTFLQRQSNDVVRVNQGGECAGSECEGGKWGLVNHRLGRTLAAQYHLIRKFDPRGLALANVGGKCGYDTCDGGRWGLVNLDAVEVLPPRFLKVVIWTPSEAIILDEGGWGLYNMGTQRQQIPCKYQELTRLGKNRIGMRHDKLWGVLKDNGDTIAPPIYDQVKDIGQGWLGYRKGPFWGLLDSTGVERIAPRFVDLQMNPFAWVTFRQDRYWGLADTLDRDITRGDLNPNMRFYDGFAIVQRGGFGVVDRKGSEIVPLKYDRCDWVGDSLFFTQNGNLLRWYNRNGQTVKSLAFDSLDRFTANNVAKGRYKGRWGIINTMGDWVADPEYDEVLIYLQAAKGRKGDGDWDFFYFNEDGRSSKVKRIVIMKAGDEEEPADLLSIQGAGITGWFSTTRNLWGLRHITTLRIIIEPKFKAISLIPNQEVTAVMGRPKGSEDWAWGLVNHRTGEQITEFLYDTIYVGDYAQGRNARAVFHGSGKFALLDLGGGITSFANAGYIGPFVDGKARINLGGRLEWGENPGQDTLRTLAIVDRYTLRTRYTYYSCLGGKWGFIDKEGAWLHPADYETALDFQGGLARVRINGKWGVVDPAFRLVVEPRYDFIHMLTQAGGRSYYLVGMDETKYGFINERGEIAVRPAFAEVGRYHGGLVRIREGNRWGYADREGRVVIAPQYYESGDFHEGYARVRQARSWGFIDSLGNAVTPMKYLRAGDFHEGLAWVQGEKFFGYIGTGGQVAIAPAFSGAGNFSEGLAPVRRKGAFGLIDREGRFVLEPRYFRIGPFRDSLAVVQEKGAHGLINPRGEFVVRTSYKEIADFSEGLARMRQGYSYGFLDRTGEVRIPGSYANAGHFHCGRAAVFLQGKWGFIDTAGTEVVPPIYIKVQAFSENRAAVQVRGKWGFIDPSGAVAVPIIYDEVGAFTDGRAPVRLGSRWGFVNRDGTLLIPCRYDEIGFMREGTISVRLGKKWGLINRYGTQVTPCKYDAIGSFSEGMAPVLLRRSLGVVNDKGQVLLDPHYDTVRLNGQVLMVEDDDAFGYMSLAGQWIWQLAK